MKRACGKASAHCRELHAMDQVIGVMLVIIIIVIIGLLTDKILFSPIDAAFPGPTPLDPKK